MDMGLAARRILWGKTVNAGQVSLQGPLSVPIPPYMQCQTCVAPDYVILPQEAQAPFVEALKQE